MYIRISEGGGDLTYLHMNVKTTVKQRLATLKNAKKVRTISDIENCPFVEDLWQEEIDQLEWWVSLEEGYHSEDTECSTFHFPTIKQVCSYINAGVYVVEWVDDANHWAKGYFDRHYVER